MAARRLPWHQKEEGDNHGKYEKWMALGLFCCSDRNSCLTGSSLFAAERPPVKIGLLVSYTGIAPLQAKGVSDGVELAVAEVGQKAGGRAIQLVKEDSEFNPTVGLTKVRRLVEEQKVNFIVGPISQRRRVGDLRLCSQKPGCLDHSLRLYPGIDCA